jgi:cold shock CspA family protein
MQRDAMITYRNVIRSDAVETILAKRITALEAICPNGLGLRVTLEAPRRLRHAARGFEVRLHLDLPGPDLDVARSVRQGHASDDILRAVNEAFNALERRLKETRKTRASQDVKHHAAILHGAIVELEPQLGYGFVRADDGKEVYFQKDSLVSGDWDALEIGTRLRFREQDGEKGPFAVDVSASA